MKLGKVTKVLAAMFVGAMLLQPATASAEPYDYGHTVTPGIEAVAGFSVVLDDDSVKVRWSNKLSYWNDNNGYGHKYLRIEYSTDRSFPNNSKTGNFTGDESDNNEYTYSNLEPGLSYYFRAFIDSSSYSYDTYTRSGGYGPYSTVLGPITIPVPDARIVEKKVTANSVYFNFDNGNVTGYEIYRATGTKFKKLAKISDTVYTDSGLEANQTYNYKIRAYVYDSTNKKTTYGDWSYTTATTWGQNFRLNVTPASKNSIKLSWKKVSGANGYEIYRSMGGSSGLPTVGGYSSDFTDYKLIKTITKAKTVKYTDKKLVPGMSYSYIVVAYKNKVDKKGKSTKVKDTIIQASGSASLGLSFNVYNTVTKQDGSVQLKWKKVIGASGFKIEKYDDKTDAWVAYTTLKASATSVTLPKAASVETSDEYRIYAYRGTKKSSSYEYITHNYAMRSAMPGGVTAKAANGGTAVTVSWRAVAGAAYYEVYRSRRLGTYNADLGSYENHDTEETVRIITNAAEHDDTSEIKATSVVDQYQFYTYSDGSIYVVNDGPQPGLTYYYYVRAYRGNGKPIGSDDYDTYGSWFAKPAKVVLNSVSIKAPKLSGLKSKKAKQVTVSWKKAAGAKKYYVYYSTKKGKGYQLAGITNKTSFTVKGLNSKKSYFFKVRSYTTNAVGADYFSGYSAAKKVKVK